MLNKQTLDISFSQGLDTKTDPFRVQPGKFLSLQNSVFDKVGGLTKRNGFEPLATLTNSSSTFLTTFQGNLTAVGDAVQAYSSSNKSWVTKGLFQPLTMDTLPLIRSNLNQIQCDAVASSNGLVCTVYSDSTGASVSYKYAIADAATGQNIVTPTLIPAASGGTITGSPRVFLLANYFIVVFTNVITATSHLQYIAISINSPATVTSPVDIASAYVATNGLSYDGVVAGNRLYVAYNTTTGGQSIKLTYISTTLGNPVTAVTYAGQKATLMSMTVDMSLPSQPIIYAAYYNLSATKAYALAVDQNLNAILAPTEVVSSGTIDNITCVAQDGILTFFTEIDNNYPYDGAIATHYVNKNTVSQAGVVGTSSVLVRSLGLASKAFLVNNVAYVTGIYSSNNQPTYFVVDQDGKAVSKLAYSNAGSYLTLGLPSAVVTDSTVVLPYLVKDSVISTNKTQGATVSASVYAQTGINLASATFETKGTASEIGGDLNLSGGFLWMYDGYSVVEQGFHLYPDYVEVTGSGTGGNLTAQQYFYQAIYEWSDNQGNIHRSAPSIPVSVTTTGSTSSVTVNVPTLRVTYKTANPVKIVIYRWSTANQTYYQVTSVSTPLLNDTGVDSVAYVDTLADNSIIGNSIIYTTGGVIENIGPPATDLVALFNNRLFLVDSEDRNLLWFSKQVIEATPVEMSDLFTIYVAPTTSAQATTGDISALSPMDDKLIIFKRNAIGYINGIGPDNTGTNNQYSDFVLVNAVVGCANQQSIVQTPSGLMFQSAKGIWLLSRDLGTSYIGAPVEKLTTGATVLNAINIPMTTQVRFTLDSGVTLMYDYFFDQWGTFVNVPAVSSAVYQNLHTYLNSRGQVLQETPGVYLDDSSPVLMSFTTSWLNLAGVQGFERFYHFYMLGTTISPFKLNVQLAYDYNSSITQNVIVTPPGYSANWGDDPLWGSSSPWGGSSDIFEARVFPERQKCESFQLTINELFDSTVGLGAGAGLTLSGLNIVAGLKKGYRTSSSSRSFG